MSPATGHADTEWFDQFWAECALLGCRFDFLATHFYDARSAENTIKVTQSRYRYVIYLHRREPRHNFSNVFIVMMN